MTNGAEDNRADREGAQSMLPGEIPEALAAWRSGASDARSRALQEQLYRLCVRLSVQVMGDAAGGSCTEGRQTALDLAHSFLEEVLSKGTAMTVESRSGLRQAIRRHWHATRDPASRELWKTLSAALRELAKEGRAQRVDADGKTEANHNDALWTNVAGGASAPADLLEFERRCEAVPPCQPPDAGKWLKQGKPARKIISPADAKELAARLLACAGGGWVKMGELFVAFRGKVHLFDETPISKGIPRVPAPPVAEREEVFLALAAEVAGRIWGRAESRNLVRVLCGYYLPKLVREEKVRMEDFGPSSTVHDQSRQIMAIIQEELAPQDLLPPNLDVALQGGIWHGRLVTETMACLETFCDCQPEN